MQQKILRSKNNITLISGILIAIGFIAHFGFANEQIFNVALLPRRLLG